MNIGILGTGYAAPAKVLTNHDLEKIVETSDEWIQTRTGIRERRIAEKGSATSDWAVEACNKALENANATIDEIDLIVMGTTTPDQPLPSCACIVQRALQAINATCFDVSAACSGYIYALVTARHFLASGTYKKALVVGADQISSFLDWTDRSTCVLFGDAAGASVLGEVSGRGIIASDIGSNGEYADLLCIPGGGSRNQSSAETVSNGAHYLKMNGAEVFKLAVRGMASSIERVLQESGISIDQVACIIPHQANMRIIDAVAKRLNVSQDKLFINLDRYGNTSAASVIVALSEAREKRRVVPGDIVLLTTFGAGLVWGSTLIEI
ncbi:MAG: ketoacyl-ACP synthase III [Candidatus Omnitrophica bacterium]|nr:ketoacyl-ACP synthase III [Candidatus Omnitrophota bacterium]